MMKITHDMTLNLHPIFFPLDQLLGAILDFGFLIADLLYRFALSFFTKLICRRINLKNHQRTPCEKSRGIV